MFKLFRALGLRHLVVVDNRNEVSPRGRQALAACGQTGLFGMLLLSPGSARQHGASCCPFPAGGGHGHPQGSRQVPPGEGRTGGALAGTDVMWGSAAQRDRTLAPLRLGPSFGRGRERTGLACGGIVVPGALAQLFCPGSPVYRCLPTSASSSPPRPFLCFPEGSKYAVGSVSSLSKLTEGCVKAGACLGSPSALLSWVLSLCPGPCPLSLLLPWAFRDWAPPLGLGLALWGGEVAGLSPAPRALSPLPMLLLPGLG